MELQVDAMTVETPYHVMDDSRDVTGRRCSMENGTPQYMRCQLPLDT